MTNKFYTRKQVCDVIDILQKNGFIAGFIPTPEVDAALAVVEETAPTSTLGTSWKFDPVFVEQASDPDFPKGVRITNLGPDGRIAFGPEPVGGVRVKCIKTGESLTMMAENNCDLGALAIVATNRLRALVKSYKVVKS